MLVCFDFRKFVEDGLGKLALLQILKSVVADQKPPAALRLRLLVVGVFRVFFHVIRLPEHDDGAFLTLTDVSVKLVSLAHRESKR
jgi:hypothetical protein